MTAKINHNDWLPSEAEQVTFGEILVVCHKAGVRVFEGDSFDTDRSEDSHIPKFFHQQGNGERHGPFKYEEDAWEDAYLTYRMWPY